MRSVTRWAIALSILLGAALPAAAQPAAIQVPAGAGWKHAASGLILRPTLAGLARGAITDNSNAELDVSAQYRDAGGATLLTVFVYRPALASLPIWFDRSDTAITHPRIFFAARPVGDPLAFAPPGAANASALRRTYVPGKPGFTSTSLAMLPLGEWLVALRISSSTLDPAAIDALMTGAIAGLGWPKDAAEAPAAATVVPCAQPLAYAKRAKMKRPSMTDALLGATMFAVASTDERKAEAARQGPVTYCRELTAPGGDYTVFRDSSGINGYALALGDAGQVLWVQPSMPLDGPSFGVSLGRLDGVLIYPPFDKLPEPAKALEAVRRAAPISSTSRDGKNISISTGTH